MSKILAAEARDLLLLKAKNDPKWVKEYVENRWLNLGDISVIPTENLFVNRTEFDIQNPDYFLIDLMRKPENFGFTASVMFNKYAKLAPFQIAILQELWKRPFPMLIGSRGAGKCIKGDTLIMTGDRICRIEELAVADEMEAVVKPGLKVLGENGFKDVAYAWNNGVGETKKIQTRHGFEIEGTLNHPIRVVSEGAIVWKNMSELKVGDVTVIDRSSDHWYTPSNNLDPQTAYFFGLLVGDGGYTIRGRISFTTADPVLAEAVDKAGQRLWGKPFVKLKAKYAYNLYSVDAWDELFNKYGFNSSVCGEKAFPTSVLGASKQAMSAFIRGLMDTDGSASKKGVIEYCSKSERLVRTLQFVLTRFGIIARVKRRRNKKYDQDYFYLFIMGENTKRFSEEIGFGLDRKQNVLDMANERITNSNTDIIPSELILEPLLTLRNQWSDVRPPLPRGYNYQRQLLTPSRLKAYGTTYKFLDSVLTETSQLSGTDEWKKLDAVRCEHLFFDKIVSVENSFSRTYDVHVPDDHSFISNGFVSHNSFLLALYAVLRALFEQGRRIVIVGAAFRQAKVVFDYCQELWEDSAVLRDLVGKSKHNGPRRDVDRCTLRLGESLIVALPMGDGSKIRGQRASIVESDEFASQPIDIFERVIRGFGAVSMAPVAKMIEEYGRVALKELNLWNEEHDILQKEHMSSNQTIISGTAYYAFNHFYDYWRKYKAIIETKGDLKKMAELSGGKVDPNLNWKDFSIIRIPAERLPPGFMDQKQLAQARATVHTGTFAMEYGACTQPYTEVLTENGAKAIVDINVGDLVLTHKGRFRPVTKRMFRHHNGDVVKWSTEGYDKPTITTPNHPFWINGTWKLLEPCDTHTELAIASSNEVARFAIREYTIEPYCGFVYNLEVEEDNSYSLLNATVHNCFTSDSNGFFRRSLIESCVVGKPTAPIEHGSCGPVRFHAVLRGNPLKKYIIAVDPASERDNFSIVVLEQWPDHRRIVHCWTTNRSIFNAKTKKGMTDGEDNFYNWAARKIRDLMKAFPAERIAIDFQGGGVSIVEALHDRAKLKEGERPIYPVIDPDDPKDTDGYPGDHILEIIQFSRAEWVSSANHGMRKDFEDRVLLFPEFNSAVLGLALEEDKVSKRVLVDDNDRMVEKLYDTLDDCVCEIEELKDELATIVHTQTGQSLRDRWDTPEVKQEGGKKGRLRKDRYSALLMANAVARQLASRPAEQEYTAIGGFAHEMNSAPKSSNKEMWIGPSWWTEKANDIYEAVGGVIRR